MGTPTGKNWWYHSFRGCWLAHGVGKNRDSEFMIFVAELYFGREKLFDLADLIKLVDRFYHKARRHMLVRGLNSIDFEFTGDGSQHIRLPR